MRAIDYAGHVPAEPASPARARWRNFWRDLPGWFKLAVAVDLAVLAGASAVGIIQAVHP